MRYCFQLRKERRTLVALRGRGAHACRSDGYRHLARRVGGPLDATASSLDCVLSCVETRETLSLPPLPQNVSRPQKTNPAHVRVAYLTHAASHNVFPNHSRRGQPIAPKFVRIQHNCADCWRQRTRCIHLGLLLLSVAVGTLFVIIIASAIVGIYKG